MLKQLLIMMRHEVRNVCRTDHHVVDFSMIKEISDFVRLRTNSARGSQFSRQGDLPFENDSSLGASQDRHAGRGRSLRQESIALLREDNVLKHILAQKGEVRCY